jgi:hypothetical protein
MTGWFFSLMPRALITEREGRLEFSVEREAKPRENKCRLSLRERMFLRGAKDDNSGNLFWRGA